MCILYMEVYLYPGTCADGLSHKFSLPDKVVRDAFYRDTMSSSAARLQEPWQQADEPGGFRISLQVLCVVFEQTSFHYK